MPKAKKLLARLKRKVRIKKKICGTADRPRLTVFRSLKHIYAQVIDDSTGHTILAMSTLNKDVSGEEGGDKKEIALRVGAEIAKKCQEKKIEKVIFDRNGFLYHGRIKALADGARKAGLEF